VASTKPRTDLFERIISQHSETLDARNPRDFVDMYLDEVRRTENKASSFHPSVGGIPNYFQITGVVFEV